ncbi:MAG: hypothetical protein EA379_00650 [Phycisphaerales bacterium]|nr:MAG: hypothetical protein EA379_00650 [Phycisphaerales bacterium]
MPGAGAARRRPLPLALLKLARPTQWSKSAFVLIGPFYGLRDMAETGRTLSDIVVPAFIAAVAFALASSACYVVNDILDREADRRHPRKSRRPVASGEVSVKTAWVFALALLGVVAVLTMLLPAPQRWWMALALGLYVLNVSVYSAFVKHLVIVDVMSLSMGFVLRVMGGCAAVAIVPSVWLLNVTLFLAMFLSFGKRLGERRTMGAAGDAQAAASHRPVQEGYTDTLLQMSVVVTGVATLMGYAAYVQSQDAAYAKGFSLLWLTILPATYCLLRAIVLLERGEYDDPTELAMHDRAFQAGAALFAIVTAVVFWIFRPMA